MECLNNQINNALPKGIYSKNPGPVYHVFNVALLDEFIVELTELVVVKGDL